MAYFAKRAGDLDMVALPNKNGASGVIQDMLRGDVQAAFLNVAQHRRHGAVRASSAPLAVVNHTRLPDYPDVPTMKEVGYPDVGTIAWNGLFAPAATPKPVLEALYASRNEGAAIARGAGKIRQAELSTSRRQVARTMRRQWLDGEIKHWQTITSAVKIDVRIKPMTVGATTAWPRWQRVPDALRRRRHVELRACPAARRGWR